jgi:hypothetical protein
MQVDPRGDDSCNTSSYNTAHIVHAVKLTQPSCRVVRTVETVAPEMHMVLEYQLYTRVTMKIVFSLTIYRFYHVGMLRCLCLLTP